MADEKMEPLDYLRKLLSEAADATRTLLKDFASALMSAEATAGCGAEYGARAAERASCRQAAPSRA
jgi:transposase-like protein